MNNLIPIDKGFDPIVESEYLFYALPFSEFKKIAKSWYTNIDFSDFDNRYVNREGDEANLVEMKKSGLICNIFFAYIEDGKYYLLDGFNRLFSSYADIDIEQTVYIKLLHSKLEDYKLMSVMFKLNMWKLYSSDHSYSGFGIKDFLDRGFKLLLKTKFDIEFYKFPRSTEVDWYDKRLRKNEDLQVIEHYFVNESESCGDFKYSYKYVAKLFSNPNIINDFRNIIAANNYNKSPFKNYESFMEGWMYFLSLLRLRDYNSNIYTLDFFLEKLYADKTFFKKLQGMSGTDSTRKNIYKWFRNLKID